MASTPSLFYCMFFIVSIAATNSPVEASKEFKVGWRTPDANESAIYDQWAARKRFRVGDSLRESLNALKSSVLFLFLLTASKPRVCCRSILGDLWVNFHDFFK